MGESRREFLKKTALLGLGTATLPALSMACNNNKEKATKEFGVQIYSVRNELSQDFEGTLQKIADMGYDYIEAFGLGTDGMYFGQTSPAEFRDMVEGMGMRIASTHSSYFTAEDAPTMLQAAKNAGVDQLIIPYLSEEHRTDYELEAQNLNQIGEVFKDSGIKFGYHNHDFEFIALEDGRLPMEILLENTDPELVTFQLDVYWITKAGQDAMDFIQKYPGRFSSYHIKDADEDLNQTTVGKGIIDYKTLLSKNDEFGITHLFVEDEREDHPIENIKAAHDYLQELSF